MDWTCPTWEARSANRPGVSESTFYNLLHEIPSPNYREFTFDLARHHVIPYHVLYKFFNMIFESATNPRIEFLLGQFISNLITDLNIRQAQYTEDEILQSIRQLFRG